MMNKKHIDYVMSVVAPGRNGGGDTPTPGPTPPKPAGGGIEPSDVTFYDYDGTVIAAYTLSEVQKLTELPAAPSHNGLVFDDWNWTLEDIQAAGYEINVGAMYRTSDGKTRLYLNIPYGSTDAYKFYFTQSADGAVTIDWGDGSASEVSGKAVAYGNYMSHAYTQAGEYIITMTVADGCTIKLGNNTQGSNTNIVGMGNTVGSQYPSNFITAVHIGDRVDGINLYCFYRCRQLKYVTMPQSVTDLGHHIFYMDNALGFFAFPSGVELIPSDTFNNSASLIHVSIPASVDNIASNAFSGCTAMRDIYIPAGVTTLNNSVCMNNTSLTKAYIPDGVTTTGQNSMYSCSSLIELTLPSTITTLGSGFLANDTSLAILRMKGSVPPTLPNTSSLSKNAFLKIIVPKGAGEAYRNATNWANYNIVEED